MSLTRSFHSNLWTIHSVNFLNQFSWFHEMIWFESDYFESNSHRYFHELKESKVRCREGVHVCIISLLTSWMYLLSIESVLFYIYFESWKLQFSIYCNLHGNHWPGHSPNLPFVYSIEEIKSNKSGMTWGWVNDDRIFFLGWTIHSILSHVN